MNKLSGTQRLHETCIPVQVDNVTATIHRIVDVETGRGIDDQVGPCMITHGDPHVIAIPGGQGYLMVLTAYLTEPLIETQEPSNSRTQIVGWWSDVDTFDSARTVGPFLLVEGSHCLSDDLHPRMWVSVPGVALVDVQGLGPTLYVYYVVEESELGYVKTERKPRKTPDPLASTSTTLSVNLQDQVLKRQYRQAISDGGFKKGFACKRISWEVLWRDHIAPELALGGTAGPGSGGLGVRKDTNDSLWDTRDEVEGDLLGLVRVWFAGGSFQAVSDARADGSAGSPYATGTRVVSAPLVIDFWDVYDATIGRLAAPHPVVCGRTGLLSMFFAVSYNNEGASDTPFRPEVPTSETRGTGHGIYRARALPADTLLMERTGTIRRSTFGRDFVLAPLDSNNHCADLVSPAQDDDGDGVYEHLMIDPGATQLPDGSWWVIAGTQDLDTMTVGTLRGFEGERLDACTGWGDLYLGIFQGSTSFKYDPMRPIPWRPGSWGRDPAEGLSDPAPDAGDPQWRPAPPDRRDALSPHPGQPPRMSLDAIRASAEARTLG